MSGHSNALARLGEQDARLRAACGPLRSLAPGRAEPTPLARMGECWLTSGVPPAVGEAFADAVVEVVTAQVRNFPDNLFWDFDLPARALYETALRTVPNELPEQRRALVALHDCYGVHSAIRFRYTHDFIYGFDWARWVRSKPAEREQVGPFDPPFLQYTLGRGGELLALIEGNDAKYPKIAPHERRNPFRFSREPAEEEWLLRDLVERDLVPVKAWDPFERPVWDRPFAQLREERAALLGIGSVEATGSR